MENSKRATCVAINGNTLTEIEVEFLTAIRQLRKKYGDVALLALLMFMKTTTKNKDKNPIY